MKNLKYFLLIILIAPISLYANNGEHNIINKMTILVFQLGIILFVSKGGSLLFSRLKLPSVLGELSAGILISPFLLGSIPLPGFPTGIFSVAQNSAMPVSPELYSFATLASILLLFISGLETDLALFLRFSLIGSIVGLSGVIASFAMGVITATYFLHIPVLSPEALFLGVMSTATSVGITARILSEKRKMDSPEGVTILAGAVIDDVLGIILLAIVIGVSLTMKDGGAARVNWGHVGFIAIKAISVWLGFTALGLFFAPKISKFLKNFREAASVSIMALGLTLLLAGVFEKAGLAMIIGAYVMGLTLSKTDLSYVIQEALHPLYIFLVPIFFTVMGMMVNVKAFLNHTTLIFGLIYTLGAIIAKLFGCSIPTLFFKFNKLGALRIGMGMIPRGEVALIIAGIGLSHGVLNDDIFGVSILMTLLTTLIPPPILNKILNNKKGLNKEIITNESILSDFDFPNHDIANFVVDKIIDTFRKEAFFINKVESDHDIYQIRKENIFISLVVKNNKIIFDNSGKALYYVKTIVFEALVDLHQTINKFKNLATPNELRKEIATDNAQKNLPNLNLCEIIKPEYIKMDLQSNKKEDIIKELINILYNFDIVLNKEMVFNEVMNRENSMSTGMQDGIAIPHGRTNGIKKIVGCIGFHKKGVDFDSIDGKPTHIFAMILSPEDAIGPHIQFLSTLATILSSKVTRDELLTFSRSIDVWKYFKNM